MGFRLRASSHGRCIKSAVLIYVKITDAKILVYKDMAKDFCDFNTYIYVGLYKIRNFTHSEHLLMKQTIKNI